MGSYYPQVQDLNMNEVAELRLSATYTETDICSILLQYVFPHLIMLIFCHQASPSQGAKSGRIWREVLLCTQFPIFKKLGTFPFRSMRSN